MHDQSSKVAKLKASTWLSNVTNDAGQVHLLTARVRTTPVDMVQVTLGRVTLCAGQTDWELCCRVLVESSSWETEERLAEERFCE